MSAGSAPPPSHAASTNAQRLPALSRGLAYDQRTFASASAPLLSLHPEANDPGASVRPILMRPQPNRTRRWTGDRSRNPRPKRDAECRYKGERRRERQSQQHEKPQPRGKKAMERCVGRWSCRRRNEPENQQRRTDAERDARQSMRDRKHRGKLGPVNLNIGRKRSIILTMGFNSCARRSFS